jgi:hypothetical protein
MICDCLPIVGVLLSEIFDVRQKFQKESNREKLVDLLTGRLIVGRRAGTDNQSARSLFFGCSIWTAGLRALPACDCLGILGLLYNVCFRSFLLYI